MQLKPFFVIFFSLLIISSCKKTDKPVQNKKLQDTVSTSVEEPEIEVMETGIIQPDWAKNAVIYEVNIRQFSKKGDFKSVVNQLNRLKELGVDLLWLMPIHPIGKENRKGKLGSYYAVKDYKGINPEFGNKEDFKVLVDSAHSLGMKVMIDWVANHTATDHVWVKKHLDFYTQDSLGNAPIPTPGTDWTDIADLNYNNSALRDSMMSAMKYWVKEFDIDGYRCDMAELVPMDFWKRVRKELDSIKPMFLLAEGNMPELHNYFNMTYGWALKDTLVSLAKDSATFNKLTNYIVTKKQKFKPHDIVMYFTTNHDENSWNYIESELFGENRYNYTILTYMLGGMPLIYNGQESGLEKNLKFFEKDSIEWKDYKYANLYKKLNELLKNNPVLWNNGEDETYEILDDSKDTFRFIKTNNNQLIAVLQNYSDKPQLISKISLNTFNLEKNILTGESNNLTGQALEIPAHSTILLVQNLN